jgi:CRP-like cAMP-binding protein
MATHPELKTKDYEKGSYIFRQFESGQEAFIIKSGQVELLQTTNENGAPKETVLDILEVGTVFGEIALIDKKPRMASARAYSDDVSLLVLTSDQFTTMLDTTNPFIKKLLAILVGLVRSNVK